MNHHLIRLQQGRHHDPFEYLGRHQHHRYTIIRAFMPTAEAVELVGIGPMRRVEGSDLFVLRLSPEQNAQLPEHYQLHWQDKQSGDWHMTTSPYSFAPQLSALDLHLFTQGKHYQVWQLLGAHYQEIDGIAGCLFAVWAPYVQRVSVVGDFNQWNGLRHPMRNRGQSGVWELFIPDLKPGDAYKFEILNQHGQLLVKTDPYAQQMGLRPETVSIIAEQKHQWQDGAWLVKRKHWDWQHQPLSIYEVHLGSWRRHEDGSFYSYRELAEELIPYVKNLGYTHIELLPIMEHPLDESWGYQVAGYYAPTARFGDADGLRYFIDRCHQAEIGVLLDWVPAHFPRDDWALARFIGEPLYEHGDPRRGEHKDWGTLIFDFGRNEVRNFLIANALYWIEVFHIDGLRVDAVASMLYLDYSRREGEWLPNQYGGRENLEAIDFFKELNTVLHQKHPGVISIAEESTAWPMVSRPTYLGGLGFSMKWNMGWMHDTLNYFQQDPIYRKYHHDKLTFSQLYAWSENFVLPFSHDEVVHLKKSLVDKMPGDLWQKMANLRLLYAYQYAHPGKKLLFMGGEIAQWTEWNANQSLPWHLLDRPEHAGIQRLIQDLNRIYGDYPALHDLDFDAQGFQWIDCHDSEQSILSFMRRSREGQTVVCLFNFTPVPRLGYRIGVPAAQSYREILNTDSQWYGGSNIGNGGWLAVEQKAWMGFEHSLALNLPPLAALILLSDHLNYSE